MPWWRIFKGKGEPAAGTPIGPRRRAHERYPYAASLRARCSSWTKFLELTTGDVSAGGIYVPTEEPANVGDTVDIDLTLPDERDVRLKGTVVAIVDAKLAARHGKRPGLGIQLEPPEGEARAAFDEVLRIARAAIPPAADEIPIDLDAQIEQEVPVEEIDDEDVLVDSSEETAAVRADAAEAQPPPPEPAPAEPPPAPAQKPPEAAPYTFARSGWTDPIVGIDFGTTYTSMAAVVEGKIRVLRNDLGNNTTPSCVSFPAPGRMMIGEPARELMVSDPRHTVASIKRLLGRQFHDRDVQRLLAQADFKSREADDGTVIIDMHNEPYAIPQLAGYVIDHVRRSAEAQLGQPIHRAVFTAPVAYDKSQMDALRMAAKLAHLEIVAVIDEPSAAALANRYSADFGGVIAIYDFGGGTFDVSLVDASAGDFRVLVTGGDSWLGGDDFDAALTDAVANKLWHRYEIEVRKRAVELQRLLFASERTKRILSEEMQAPLVVPEYLRTREGMMDLRINVTRHSFQKLGEPVINRSLAVMRDALNKAEVRSGGLDTIFLSGGTTYIPAVRRALVDRFGCPVRTGVPPEHAACLGACIHAAQLAHRGHATLTPS